MLNFKQYLDEQELLNQGSTSASTLFEGVLVDCWNMSVKYNVSSKWSNNKDQKKFTKEILNLPDTFAFLKASKSKKEWATTGKTPEEQGELFWGLSKLCKQKIKGVSGDAKGAGSTKKTLSGKWKEITGKTVDTSKADIIIGDTGISVKAPAANIMSGKQLEGKATVIAAMEKSKGSEVTKNILLGYLDKFVTEANTVGAEWSGRKIKNEDPKELEGINSEIQKDLLKAEGVFKSLSENAFKNAFSNPSVGNAFAYEAMTGEEKFAGRVFGDVGDETGEEVFGYEKLKTSLGKYGSTYTKMAVELIRYHVGNKNSKWKKPKDFDGSMILGLAAAYHFNDVYLGDAGKSKGFQEYLIRIIAAKDVATWKTKTAGQVQDLLLLEKILEHYNSVIELDAGILDAPKIGMKEKSESLFNQWLGDPIHGNGKESEDSDN